MNRVAVVIPAGPRDDVVDTVHSVLHYLTDPAAVVVVDDTRGLRDLSSLPALGVEIVPAPGNARGGQGGLFVKLAAGFRHALDLGGFDLLLRLDADALVIGPGLEKAAAERFAAAPGVGMLGSYRIGPDGGRRDWTPAATSVRAESGPRGLRHPSLRARMRELVAAALPHGYEYGEHPLGGAYLLRADVLGELGARGWLDLPELARSKAGEDHLFGLLVRAAGYAIGDFGGPDDPLAVRWKGLPASPDELVHDKMVTHSVRHWADLTETEIRRRFAGHRAGQ
ncbi:hypothetical protein [Actinocorallia longicatena]|uniref:Glycosyl transferase family 2 n=1 Tax=Actinocorallia longicatena TaxID=111803 RepID=A0ABP6QGP2_9ACTN